MRSLLFILPIPVALLAPPWVFAAPAQTGRTVAVQPGSATNGSTLSRYERDILSTVLAERKLTLESNPDGKSVESVEIEPLDVFEKADPAPQWLNWFHSTTRTSVIERELLFRTGQKYDQRLVDETARNLRKFRQYSLILVVPVESEDPSRVRLLVITKDVWSLRLNTAYSSRNYGIEHLALVPSEINVAGTHLSLSGQYEYDVSTNTFGGTVSHPRLFGSWIRTKLSVNAVQYRKTGEFEGSFGQFQFSQPLYSTRTKWAWGTSLAWRNQMMRPVLPDASGAYVPRLYRDPTTRWMDPFPYRRAIPYEYHVRHLSWQTAVTRSFGYERKLNVSFGLEALQSRYDTQGLISQGYAPELVRSFEQNALPQKNSRIGPFLTAFAYRNDYVSMYDVETLGLQEDMQIGPQVVTKIYSGTKRALGTRDIIGVLTGLEYTFGAADSLIRLWAIHSTELSPRHEDSDGLIQGGLRMVSPRLLGIGRFVYDGGGLYHYQNTLNSRYTLGGDTRLRGYASKNFLGHHLIASNLEFRTRSVKILEVLFGLVGFYDAGDAFDTGQFNPKQSIGVGGRATFPQFQRYVARLDLAFPVSAKDSEATERTDAYAVWLTLGGQAFPMPALESYNTQTPLLPTVE